VINGGRWSQLSTKVPVVACVLVAPGRHDGGSRTA
jgi:hypothetical protein